MPTETTKAVPFLSDEQRDELVPYKGSAAQDAFVWGFDVARDKYEAELTRLRQLLEEARVALVDASGMVNELALAKLFPATVINEDYVNKKVDEYISVIAKLPK